MAWTTPKTWTDGNVLTAAELNEQVRDNLNFLYAKPTDDYVINGAANYSTTSTTFVDVDATNLSLTLTSGGGDLLVWFSGTTGVSSGARGYTFLDLDLDGSRVGGDDGLVFVSSYGASLYAEDKWRNIVLLHLLKNVAAGSHTIKLQWMQAGGTVDLFVNGSTLAKATVEIHPQFGVKEL